MQDEAKFMIDAMGLSHSKPNPTGLPIITYTGTFSQKNIILQLNGVCPTYGVDNIGTEAATLNAYTGISRYKPDIVINAGTAGGFLRYDAKVGDVYLSAPHVSFHDRRINLPGFVEYGIGNYPCFPASHLAEKLGLRTGIVSTGSALDFTPTDLEIMLQNGAEVKEMEAAAIAWVCTLLNTPFLAVKAITDIVDGHVPTEKEFLANLNFASEQLGIKTVELVELL